MADVNFVASIDEVISAAFRMAARNPETDVVYTAAIRDESGNLLLGWSWGTRPEAFEGDLFPDLTISVGKPYCTTSGGERPAPVTFTTPSGTCTVNDTSDADCTLWGMPYAVRVYDSYERNQQPSPVVTFTIAKPGRLLPGTVTP